MSNLQQAYDEVWEKKKPRVSIQQLLKYQPFIDLIEHSNILAHHRAIYGNQLQLIQYDLLRQGPKSSAAEYSWKA